MKARKRKNAYNRWLRVAYRKVWKNAQGWHGRCADIGSGMHLGPPKKGAQ